MRKWDDTVIDFWNALILVIIRSEEERVASCAVIYCSILTFKAVISNVIAVHACSSINLSVA